MRTEVPARTVSGGRRRAHEQEDASLDKARAAQLAQLELKRAFDEYASDHSLPKAIALHNKLHQWMNTYWNASELRDLGLRTPAVRAVFDQVEIAVEQRTRTETAAAGGDPSASLGPVFDKLRGRSARGQKITFFDEVGVPASFYSSLTPEQVKLFKGLYGALKARAARSPDDPPPPGRDEDGKGCLGQGSGRGDG